MSLVTHNISSEITSIKWSIYPYDKSINEETSIKRLFNDPTAIADNVAIKINTYYFESSEFT